MPGITSSSQTVHFTNPDDDYSGDADPADIGAELEDRDDDKAVNAFWVPEDAAGSRTLVRHLNQIPKLPLPLRVLTYTKRPFQDGAQVVELAAVTGNLLH